MNIGWVSCTGETSVYCSRPHPHAHTHTYDCYIVTSNPPVTTTSLLVCLCYLSACESRRNSEIRVSRTVKTSLHSNTRNYSSKQTAASNLQLNTSYQQSLFTKCCYFPLRFRTENNGFVVFSRKLRVSLLLIFACKQQIFSCYDNYLPAGSISNFVVNRMRDVT